jgi:hypothetical protein
MTPAHSHAGHLRVKAEKLPSRDPSYGRHDIPHRMLITCHTHRNLITWTSQFYYTVVSGSTADEVLGVA